jgi:hypothetical protein
MPRRRVQFFDHTGLRPGPAPQSRFYLPLRASRRPSSVNAALRSSGLPLTSWRMTHRRRVRALVLPI